MMNARHTRSNIPSIAACECIETDNGQIDRTNEDHENAPQDFREFGNALAFLQRLSEASAGLDCLKFVQTVPIMGLSSSKKWDPKRTRLVAATTALIRGADFTVGSEFLCRRLRRRRSCCFMGDVCWLCW